MDKVRIFVVAGPNKGKTTIAHILKDALESHSFRKVELVDTKPTAPENKQPIEQRVQATKERPVSIEVVSIAPDPASANAVPSIVAREWLLVLRRVREDLPRIGNATSELDNIIEELQALTR